MTTQQQIIECEQELSSLLDRVLAGTLDPIRLSMEASNQKLDALEQEFRGVQIAQQALEFAQEETNEALKRLQEAQKKIMQSMGGFQAECRDSLLAAQDQRHSILTEKLEDRTVERAEWLARTLGSKVDETADSQQRSLVETRDLVSKQVLGLQAGTDAVAQRLDELSSQLVAQRLGLQGLEASGEAMQREVSSLGREVKALQEDCTRHMQALIKPELRTMRHILIVTLTLTIGTIALSLVGHWSQFMR